MSTKNTTAKKDYSLLMKIVAIVLAVIVIGLAVFSFINSSGAVLRSKTAAKSENYKVNGTEMAYYSGMMFQQYYKILEYFGADPNVSLKSQQCSMLEDGGTWFDYFMDMGKESVSELLALAEYAKANGIELDDEDKKTVDANLATLEADADEQNYPIDAYINGIFHNGMNEKDVRRALELSTLAAKASEVFVDKVNVSAEAMDKYYAEHPEEFDGVDYYTYTLDLSAEQTDAEAAEGTEESEDVTAVDGTASLNFIAGMTTVNGVDSFRELVYNYEAAVDPEADEDALNEKVDATLKQHILKSAVADEELAEWLFSAKQGEVYLPEEDAGVYTITVLAKEAYRQDNLNRSMRQVLIASDAESEEDEALAQQILDELKAADFSEEKWIELAKEYSTDEGSVEAGGLYDNVGNGQFVTELNDWLFDEAREAGDSTIVESSYGWHIAYYVGETDTAAWMTAAESAIKNSEYASMIEEYGASVEFDDSVLGTIVLN